MSNKFNKNTKLFGKPLFFGYNLIKENKLDASDFTSRDVAYKGFVAYRKAVLDHEEDGRFMDAFTELCAIALSGDCVAQDCVAYFFNRGVPNLLSPNYNYYMSWLILAGANGNIFAMEKLEFFLGKVVEAIIDDEEILYYALKNRNISKNNAIHVITNLLCEGVVDELKLNPKNLIEIKKEKIEYSPQKERVFTTALDNCIKRVLEYLVS